MVCKRLDAANVNAADGIQHRASCEGELFLRPSSEPPDGRPEVIVLIL